jgi:hypothetical protein
MEMALMSGVRENKWRLSRFLTIILCYGVMACAIPRSENAGINAETQLTRAQWHARLNWDVSDCPLASPDEAGTGVVMHDFGADARIIEVQCERWAYQGSYLFYLVKDGVITQLNFEQFEAPDAGRLERYHSALVTGLPSVVADEQALDVFRKYRGIGDCGQFLRYRIEAQAAVLKQLRVRDCEALPDDKPIDTQEWPLKNHDEEK